MGISVKVWLMPKHDKKGKHTNKNVNPLRKEKGLSWVEAFIDNRTMFDKEAVDKMIMLEPREWLDYAVVGVTEDNDADGKEVLRCVYDLNIVETLYAVQYAYEEKPYKGMKYDEVVFRLSDDHVIAADEWVSYNTIRGTKCIGLGAPLFIRAMPRGALRLESHFEGLE